MNVYSCLSCNPYYIINKKLDKHVRAFRSVQAADVTSVLRDVILI